MLPVLGVRAALSPRRVRPGQDDNPSNSANATSVVGAVHHSRPAARRSPMTDQRRPVALTSRWSCVIFFEHPELQPTAAMATFHEHCSYSVGEQVFVCNSKLRCDKGAKRLHFPGVFAQAAKFAPWNGRRSTVERAASARLLHGRFGAPTIRRTGASSVIGWSWSQ